MFHNHFVTLIAFSRTHVAIQSQIVASRKASSGENRQDSRVRAFGLIAGATTRRLLKYARCVNPANPLRRNESFLIAGRRITGKKKSGGKLQATRRSLVQGTTREERLGFLWGVRGQSGWIDKGTQSGWRMIVQSDKILWLH
jgi:hypothetical protein